MSYFDSKQIGLCRGTAASSSEPSSDPGVCYRQLPAEQVRPGEPRQPHQTPPPPPRRLRATRPFLHLARQEKRTLHTFRWHIRRSWRAGCRDGPLLHTRVAVELFHLPHAEHAERVPTMRLQHRRVISHIYLPLLNFSLMDGKIPSRCCVSTGMP